MNNPLFSITISNNKDFYRFRNEDIIEMYFIEDIYSFVKTGKMIFRDIDGILEFLPLTVGETLLIEYGSSIDDKGSIETKSFNFVVHKISRVECEQSQRNLIELLFVENGHYKLHNNNFSLSFKDKKYTDIIKSILTKHVSIPFESFIEWEDSSDEIQYFYTGLKTPSTDLKWLMERCKGKKSEVSGYLLYSNTKESNNSFNLITLESLLKQTKYMQPESVYQMYSSNINYINNIISYSINKVDYVSLGYLSKGVVLGYDINRKKYIRREYDYKEVIKDYTILGGYSLFDSSTIGIVSSHEELSGESNPDVMDNIYKSNWIKRYCLQQTVDIVVIGDVRRYSGGMIDIMWPSGDKSSMMDKNMMGNYLVKSITHHFAPTNANVYTQKMVLIKNGYYDSDDDSLTEATKKNKSTNKIYDTI